MQFAVAVTLEPVVAMCAPDEEWLPVPPVKSKSSVMFVQVQVKAEFAAAIPKRNPPTVVVMACPLLLLVVPPVPIGVVDEIPVISKIERCVASLPPVQFTTTLPEVPPGISAMNARPEVLVLVTSEPRGVADTPAIVALENVPAPDATPIAIQRI